MNRTIELPEPVYNTLIEAARASGVSPADWIAAKLSNGPVAVRAGGDGSSPMERLLRHAGSIDLGYPTGTDNETIDADLARAYGDPHNDEAIRAGRERLWSHVVSPGSPTGMDNERIDADLARAYPDTHEDEGGPADGSAR